MWISDWCAEGGASDRLGQSVVDQGGSGRRMPLEVLCVDHAAGSRLDDRGVVVGVLVDADPTRLDPGVHVNGLGREGMLDLTEVAEHHALALFARALHR